VNGPVRTPIRTAVAEMSSVLIARLKTRWDTRTHCFNVYSAITVHRVEIIRIQYKLEMWANAQRDGCPPNIGGALCSTPQSLADTHY